VKMAKEADLASRARSYAVVMNTWFEQLSSQLGQTGETSEPAPECSTMVADSDAASWRVGARHGGQRQRWSSAALGLTRERQEAWQKFSRLASRKFQEVQTPACRAVDQDRRRDPKNVACARERCRS